MDPGESKELGQGSLGKQEAIFWLHHVACRILFPQPGIEPAPPAVEARSLSRWTAREVPAGSNFEEKKCAYPTRKTSFNPLISLLKYIF